jgi:hypothetical protein
MCNADRLILRSKREIVMTRSLTRTLVALGVLALVLSAAACSTSHQSNRSAVPGTGSGPSQTPEARAQTLVAQARSQLGADFDDTQISCMATYAVAHPVLLESGAGADTSATQTLDPSKDLMTMVLGCVPKEQFVGYVIKSLGDAGTDSASITPALQACVSAGLSSLSTDQLASMLSDPAVEAAVVTSVATCAPSTTATAAPAGPTGG